MNLSSKVGGKAHLYAVLMPLCFRCLIAATVLYKSAVLFMNRSYCELFMGYNLFIVALYGQLEVSFSVFFLSLKPCKLLFGKIFVITHILQNN